MSKKTEHRNSTPAAEPRTADAVESMQDEHEPSPDELRAARSLAAALDGAPPGDDEVSALVALAGRARASSGLAPPLAPETRDALLDGALAAARPVERRRPTLRLIMGAVAAIFALVALGLGWIFVTGEPSDGPGGTDATAREEGRVAPTDALFDGPFPEGQTPAERVDRIVTARTRGYFSALIAERRGGRVAAASLCPSTRRP